jgi:hypothetical protein
MEVTIEKALELSLANRYPRHDLLVKLADRARQNGRTESQAACVFRSTPTYHDMMALCHENSRAAAEVLGHGKELSE